MYETEPAWAGFAREKSERARSMTPGYRAQSEPGETWSYEYQRDQRGGSKTPARDPDWREFQEKTKTYVHDNKGGGTPYWAHAEFNQPNHQHHGYREKTPKGYECGGMDFRGDIHFDPPGPYDYVYTKRQTEEKRVPRGYEIGGTDFGTGYVAPGPYHGHGPDPPRRRSKYTADPHAPVNVALAPNVDSVDPHLLVGDTVSNMRAGRDRRDGRQDDSMGTAFRPTEGFKRDHHTTRRRAETHNDNTFCTNYTRRSRSASAPRSSAPPEQRDVWRNRENVDPHPYYGPDKTTWTREPNWTRTVNERRGAWEHKAWDNDARLALPASAKVPADAPPHWASNAQQKQNVWQGAAGQLGSNSSYTYHQSQPVNTHYTYSQSSTGPVQTQQSATNYNYSHNADGSTNADYVANTGFNKTQFDYLEERRNKYGPGGHGGGHYQQQYTTNSTSTAPFGHRSAFRAYSRENLYDQDPHRQKLLDLTTQNQQPQMQHQNFSSYSQQQQQHQQHQEQRETRRTTTTTTKTQNAPVTRTTTYSYSQQPAKTPPPQAILQTQSTTTHTVKDSTQAAPAQNYQQQQQQQQYYQERREEKSRNEHVRPAQWWEQQQQQRKETKTTREETVRPQQVQQQWHEQRHSRREETRTETTRSPQPPPVQQQQYWQQQQQTQREEKTTETHKPQPVVQPVQQQQQYWQQQRETRREEKTTETHQPSPQPVAFQQQWQQQQSRREEKTTETHQPSPQPPQVYQQQWQQQQRREEKTTREETRPAQPVVQQYQAQQQYNKKTETRHEHRQTTPLAPVTTVTTVSGPPVDRKLEMSETLPLGTEEERRVVENEAGAGVLGPGQHYSKSSPNVHTETDFENFRRDVDFIPHNMAKMPSTVKGQFNEWTDGRFAHEIENEHNQSLGSNFYHREYQHYNHPEITAPAPRRPTDLQNSSVILKPRNLKTKNTSSNQQHFTSSGQERYPHARPLQLEISGESRRTGYHAAHAIPSEKYQKFGAPVFTAELEVTQPEFEHEYEHQEHYDGYLEMQPRLPSNSYPHDPSNAQEYHGEGSVEARRTKSSTPSKRSKSEPRSMNGSFIDESAMRNVGESGKVVSIPTLLDGSALKIKQYKTVPYWYEKSLSRHQSWKNIRDPYVAPRTGADRSKPYWADRSWMRKNVWQEQLRGHQNKIVQITSDHFRADPNPVYVYTHNKYTAHGGWPTVASHVASFRSQPNLERSGQEEPRYRFAPQNDHANTVTGTIGTRVKVDQQERNVDIGASQWRHEDRRSKSRSRSGSEVG
ncbi:unnamed protein product, partial [Mesorhabditis spiculigera]